MLAVLGLPNIVLVSLVAAVVAVVLRSRVFGANDRRTTTWIDAWLKATMILVFIVFFAVYLPSYVMQMETVAGFDRRVQDLIGSGFFGVALVAILWGLRRAHQAKRV